MIQILEWCLDWMLEMAVASNLLKAKMLFEHYSNMSLNVKALFMVFEYTHEEVM